MKKKQLAASEAVKLVKNGMVVGLGTGSTSAYMIRELGEKVAKGLLIYGMPSSEKSAKLARKVGIPLTSLNKVDTIDINIDGADEFNPQMQLIKGGGGALLREKIIAHNSKFNVIIVDSEKQVQQLGKFKLPIETIPFATKNIIDELDQMGLKPQLRKIKDSIFKTDENNYIVDLAILGRGDLSKLNENLISIPGVVETGLFIQTTSLIVIGKANATILIKK